jgi:L-amino acid N-acyltransferase YncA
MLNHLKDIAQIVSYLVGAFAAFAASLNYRKSSRVERAKWLAELYDKFYERDLLKPIRATLDCSANEGDSVDTMVQGETAEFTDYLNFFEFVAYLRASGQLSKGDVEAMFGYYIECLRRHASVRKYVAANGYEY